MCEAIIDNLHSNPVYSDQGTVPCVRSPDVGWGKLSLDRALKTDEAEYVRRTARGEPTAGDIVLVREGGGTGKAALVEKGQRFSLGQRVMMLRPDKGKTLPRFFLQQLLSPRIYEEQILVLLKGSASPHLNINSLREFSFLVFPLSEQRRIVAYLDGLQAQADELTALQQATQVELDALLPSVLERAFRGEL
jgi:type I restriction enzyme S subunit